MKKLLLLFFFSLGSFNFSSAQNPLVKMWDYRFGGNDGDAFQVFCSTQNGFLLAGYSWSNISGDKSQSVIGESDFWIIKIDLLGNKDWDKGFGGYKEDRLSAIIKTNDGGYLCGGSSYSGVSGDKTEPNRDSTENTTDYWILKIDSIGNKEWDRSYGGDNFDNLISIQQTTDQGYIIGGNSRSRNTGDKTFDNWDTTGLTNDFWIIKIDSVGTQEWDKDFGTQGLDHFAGIVQDNDGSYLVGGTPALDSTGDKTDSGWGGGDYWIIKLGLNGNKIWDKSLGGSGQESLHSIILTEDSGFLLAGGSLSGISGNKTQPNWDTTGGTWDYWLLKIDSLGNTQWDRDYGGTSSDYAYVNVCQAENGSYLVSGQSISDSGGNKTEDNLGFIQTWILLVDSLGNIIWDKTLLTNTQSQDIQGNAVQTGDGCYLIANGTDAGIGGYKTQPSWGSMDYWIIKFCDSTLTTNVAGTEKENEQLLLSPNPTEGKFTISGLPFVAGQIEIYNMLGEKIYSAVQLQTSNLKPETTIDCRLFQKGIYLVKASPGEKMFTYKLVVE
ncbi:lipoprotein [soil metagenome]